MFPKEVLVLVSEPSPPEPVTGDNAAFKIFEKAVPPCVRTLAVLELFETKTAIIATAITAVMTVTIAVIPLCIIRSPLSKLRLLDSVLRRFRLVDFRFALEW